MTVRMCSTTARHRQATIVPSYCAPAGPFDTLLCWSSLAAWTPRNALSGDPALRSMTQDTMRCRSSSTTSMAMPPPWPTNPGVKVVVTWESNQGVAGVAEKQSDATRQVDPSPPTRKFGWKKAGQRVPVAEFELTEPPEEGDSLR